MFPTVHRYPRYAKEFGRGFLACAEPYPGNKILKQLMKNGLEPDLTEWDLFLASRIVWIKMTGLTRS